MGRHGRARTRWLAVGALVLVAACGGGEGTDAVASTSSRPAPDAGAELPNRLEIRPVLVVLPPGNDEVETDGLVIPARPAPDEPPLRYALGPVALTDRDVTGAHAEDFGGVMGWSVVLELTDDGTAKLEQLAGTLFRRQPPANAIAIVVDGVVQSAPAFQEPAFSGDIRITGDFTEAEVNALAAVANGDAAAVPGGVAE